MCLLFSSEHLVHAQSTFTFLDSISVEAKAIQTDRLGNIFAVSKTNQLYKFSPDGKLLSTLNYTYTGNISHIDASNPLEIYVFYRELNLVTFLDNNLAYRGELRLSDHNILQASAACRSYDNGIWVFDLGDLQLKKLSKEGELSQASPNIRQFCQAKTVTPAFIYENGERVFLNDSAQGIFVFDVFANYMKTIPLRRLVDFKVLSDEIYYFSEGELKIYQLKTAASKSVVIPDAMNAKYVSVEKERLYIATEKSIRIYKYD